MASEWNQIIGTVKAIGVWDILDIVIVAVLIYQVIKLIRETRAMQLAKGLILLLLLYFVAYNLNMKTVRFIMQNVVATGVLALVIVFQPELRRMLEHVAQTKLNKFNIFQSSPEKDSELMAVWAASTSIKIPRRLAISPICSIGTQNPNTLEPCVQAISRVLLRRRCSKCQSVFWSSANTGATSY